MSGRAASRRRKVRVLFRGVVLVLTLTLTLVAAEAIARRLAPDIRLERSSRSGGLLIPFEPNAEADMLMPEFRVRFQINAFGLRDRRGRTESRVHGKARALVLGDSFTVGWGVELEESFPYRLEEALGAEFIACGKNGGCPLWMIHQARYFAAKFKPDVALIQLFDNDPLDNWERRARFGYTESLFEVGELPDDMKVSDGIGFKVSHFFNGLLIRRRLRSLRRKLSGKIVPRNCYIRPGSLPDEKIPSQEELRAKRDPGELTWPRGTEYLDPNTTEDWTPQLRLHTKLLRQLFDELERAGIAPVVVYIPAKEHFYAKAQRPSQPLGNIHRDLLVKLCGARSIPFVDGAELFSKRANPEQLYFVLDGHLRAEGHAVLAEGIEVTLAARFPNLFSRKE